jgi:hypothetical protein
MAPLPAPTFQRPTVEDARMYVLLWGASGCGKTTLAATAPGVKAYVQFDNQGITSIANRTDFQLLDLTGVSFTSAMMEFNKADPYGMKTFINAHPDIETIVIDSLTTLAFLALQAAVTKAGGKSNIDVPGQQGYSVRNNMMRRVVQVIMQVCSETKKNLIVITHEGTEHQDDNGNTIEITMALSRSLANDVSLRFNEVWFMRDTGKERHVYLRPHGVFRPMKSRMFETSQDARFTWHFNADTLTGEGIADWFMQWQQNGGKKIPLPKK